MLTTWKQIHDKYNIIINNCVDGHLTEEQIKIYNGNFNENELNMEDCKTLTSLSNYYMLVSDSANRIRILNLLANKNDMAGLANIGCYYFPTDRKLAVEYLKRASNMNSLPAKHNLVCHYMEICDFENAMKYCNELLENNYKNVYFLAAQVCMRQGKNQDMIKYLGMGIENEEEQCMNSLELFHSGNLVFFKDFLSTLKHNKLIENKIKEINYRIQQINCSK